MKYYLLSNSLQETKIPLSFSVIKSDLSLNSIH